MKNYGNLMYGVSDRILKVIAAVALAVATLSVNQCCMWFLGQDEITVSGWLSRWMQERGIIEKEDSEIYQYGIRSGGIILLNLITAFLIGLFTEQLLVVCVFTLSFMTLRSFTGGFHCDDSLFCYIGSSLVLFIPVYMGGQFASLSVLAVVLTLAAAAGIIIIFSPMHSKNRRLDRF